MVLDTSALERSLQDIFGYFRQVTVAERTFLYDVFNITQQRHDIETAIEKEYRARVGVSEEAVVQIVKVSELLETRNGILNRPTYEQFHFGINQAARTLLERTTHLRHHYGGVAKEGDQESKELSDLSYLNLADGNYHENVLGYPNEGTVFHRAYNPDGTIGTFKIYNQTHHDNLDIRTVDISQLYTEITHIATEIKKGRIQPDLDFPKDKDEFGIETIAEFNEHFGEYVRFNILGFNWKNARQNLILEFPQPRDVVGNALVGDNIDMQEGYRILKGEIRSSVIKTKNGTTDQFIFDLYDRNTIDKDQPMQARLDQTPNNIQSYGVIPHPELALPFLMRYATSQTK